MSGHGVKETILNYKQKLSDILKTTKDVKQQFKNDLPENSRRHYNTRFDNISRLRNEYMSAYSEIGESIKALNACKDLVKQININITQTKDALDRGRAGTLEGLVRSTVKNNPSVYSDAIRQSDLVQTVLNQPYDELKRIREQDGGKKTRRKLRRRTNSRRKTSK